MAIFKQDDFIMHSGGKTDFKIECDGLTHEDMVRCECPDWIDSVFKLW